MDAVIGIGHGMVLNGAKGVMPDKYASFRVDCVDCKEPLRPTFVLT